MPLNRAALDALTSWKTRYPHAGPEDYIFPLQHLIYRGKSKGMRPWKTDLSRPMRTSWRSSSKTAKKADGVECRVHDLRHSTITRLAEKGTPIAVIQEIAGHGHMSAKMTKHYTHISDAVKRKALESLHTETVQ